MIRLIRFRRLNQPQETIKAIHHCYDGTIYEDSIPIQRWGIAFNKEHLFSKLNGDMAEIEMPAKSWCQRLWLKIHPMKAINGNGY